MQIKIKLNSATLPQCAHASDTGADLVAMNEPLIVGVKEGEDLWRRIDYLEYDCSIQVAPQDDQPYVFLDGSPKWSTGRGRFGYLQLFPRSSISKTNLVLANSVAVIDNAYRGPIKLRFRYLLQPCDMVINLTSGIYQRLDSASIYHKGDKIAQIVATWKEDIEWQIVDSLEDTVRGSGGFGSTGWKS